MSMWTGPYRSLNRGWTGRPDILYTHRTAGESDGLNPVFKGDLPIHEAQIIQESARLCESALCANS